MDTYYLQERDARDYVLMLEYLLCDLNGNRALHPIVSKYRLLSALYDSFVGQWARHNQSIKRFTYTQTRVAKVELPNLIFALHLAPKLYHTTLPHYRGAPAPRITFGNSTITRIRVSLEHSELIVSPSLTLKGGTLNIHTYHGLPFT